MPDLTQTILDAVADPAAATVDGQSVTAQPIPDLIAAQKHLQQQAAGKADATGKTRSGWGMLRAAQVRPPGAV